MSQGLKATTVFFCFVLFYCNYYRYHTSKYTNKPSTCCIITMADHETSIIILGVFSVNYYFHQELLFSVYTQLDFERKLKNRIMSLFSGNKLTSEHVERSCLGLSKKHCNNSEGLASSTCCSATLPLLQLLQLRGASFFTQFSLYISYFSPIISYLTDEIECPGSQHGALEMDSGKTDFPTYLKVLQRSRNLLYILLVTYKNKGSQKQGSHRCFMFP